MVPIIVVVLSRDVSFSKFLLRNVTRVDLRPHISVILIVQHRNNCGLETVSSKSGDITLPMKMTFGVTAGALAYILPQKLIVPSFVMFRYGEVINSFGKFSISPNTKCSFGFYSSTRSILKRKKTS